MIKYLISFLLLAFLSDGFAQEKYYKIQVFRKSDNIQLYGLIASESERAKRLGEARKVHDPNKTILINKDVTQELEDKKLKEAAKKEERKNILINIEKIADENLRKILLRIAKDFYRK